MTDLLQPSLRRYPDARQAPVMLVDPILLAYLGILFGVPVVTLLSCFNAAAVRRIGLFLTSLVLGAAGWILFIGVASRVQDRYVLVVIRLMSFIVGCLFYFLQRQYVRGHQFLGGRVLPIRESYLASFVLFIIIPWKVELLLMGVPVGWW
jgi:hypothetical protein